MKTLCKPKGGVGGPAGPLTATKCKKSQKCVKHFCERLYTLVGQENRFRSLRITVK